VTADNTDAPTAPGPGRAGRIAALPCGRRTKYVVLIFWVIVIGLTGSLAGKLMGAEKNDASAYLPASAESTQELNLQAKFTAKNLRTYPRRPAQGCRRRPDFRRLAGRPRPGGRADPRQ
jgi:hypothetical protein